MSNNIVLATDSDREQLMKIYKEQLGREFCAWDEDYSSLETIDFDLSRDALFVMKENDAKQNKGIKRFLHNLEHPESVTAWKCNNVVCIDALDVRKDRISTEHSGAYNLHICTIRYYEHFCRGNYRQIR